MDQEARAFSEKELIAEVISKNIPSAWRVQYRLAKLHLKTKIDDIISDLTLIEENIKTHPKPNHEKTNKNKQLKNPCRVHDGGHEWEDCRQNPKNQKNEDRNRTNDNNRSRNGNGNNNRSREENRRTERSGRQSSRERNRNRSNSRTRNNDTDSGTEEEYHCIHGRNEKNEEEKMPSAEILIAIPNKKGSKKYTTYLGLMDSGSSGSLVNKEIVEYADFNIKLQKKPTKWDTATGVFQTDGSVTIEQYCLPQFTRKRHITTSFHMFQKRSKDKYDFILGHDLLKELGLDIHYSASQFVWENISVDMVPSGYWTKNKITGLAKTWNAPRKELLPTDSTTKELRLT
jgi:hypothetical protein